MRIFIFQVLQRLSEKKAQAPLFCWNRNLIIMQILCQDEAKFKCVNWTAAATAIKLMTDSKLSQRNI
jgi:hypothetical protein